jgi:hypothetical protein
MHTTFNKFVIVLSSILVFSGFYLYYSNNLHSEAATSSPLTSSLSGQSPVSGSATSNEKVSVDVSFVNSLTSLTKINIDTNLFTSPAFISLKDNTVQLDSNINTGRPNPFAPIDSSVSYNSNNTLSPVITGQPTQITNNSAVFNGAFNLPVGSATAYFEYGTTEAMDKTTISVEQSLIGTFVRKVTGLASQTTYFFRAVVRVNGLPQYGDVVSFTTN